MLDIQIIVSPKSKSQRNINFNQLGQIISEDDKYYLRKKNQLIIHLNNLLNFSKKYYTYINIMIHKLQQDIQNNGFSPWETEKVDDQGEYSIWKNNIRKNKSKSHQSEIIQNNDISNKKRLNFRIHRKNEYKQDVRELKQEKITTIRVPSKTAKITLISPQFNNIQGFDLNKSFSSISKEKINESVQNILRFYRQSMFNRNAIKNSVYSKNQVDKESNIRDDLQFIGLKLREKIMKKKENMRKQNEFACKKILEINSESLTSFNFYPLLERHKLSKN